MVRRAGAVQILELTADRLPDAAAVMAAEHVGAALGGATGYEDEAVCRRALSDLLSDGYDGHVAVVDGELVGVMCLRAFPPVAFAPAHGLAIRPGDDDPTSIIVALLAVATAGLLDEGVVRLTVDHVADDVLRMALHDAGFGGGSVFATRATTPLPPDDTSVVVRSGTTDDVESIAEISHIEQQYRYEPPMHSLAPSRSITQTRQLHDELVANGGTHLVASLHGRDVGLLSIEPSSPAPRLCPHGAHIGPTATRPEVRGRGVGRALVAAAVAEARSQGHRQISVDFESTNPLSRPFWLGLGFEATGYRQRRVVRLT